MAGIGAVESMSATPLRSSSSAIALRIAVAGLGLLVVVSLAIGLFLLWRPDRQAEPEPRQVALAEGETISDLARVHLGTSRRWNEILQL